MVLAFDDYRVKETDNEKCADCDNNACEVHVVWGLVWLLMSMIGVGVFMKEGVPNLVRRTFFVIVIVVLINH